MRHNTLNKTYLKLPRYVAAYMRSVYSDSDHDIQIPEYSIFTMWKLSHLHEMLYECIRTNLVPNPFMQRSYSDHAFSQQTLDMYRSGSLVTERPFNYEEEKTICLKIPAMIWHHRGWVKTDRTFEFTRPGAQVFRKIAKYMFWTSLSLYMDSSHSTLPLNARISSFCARHQIPTEEIETVIRTYRRERKKTESILHTLLSSPSEAKS